MMPACAPATVSATEDDGVVVDGVREMLQVEARDATADPAQGAMTADAAVPVEAAVTRAAAMVAAPVNAAPVDAAGQPAMASLARDEPSSGIDLGLSDVPFVAAFAVPEPALPIGWREEGIASWYGPNFAGRLTANGEIFDPSRLTAAHKTLPFDTRIRVTNLENGRVVVVRINDRGPFIDGRIVDLARGAAEVIGLIADGTARVRLEVAGGPDGERPVRIDSRLTGYDVLVPGTAAGTLLVMTGPTGVDIVVRAVPLAPPAVPGADGTEVWMSESLATRMGAIVTMHAP